MHIPEADLEYLIRTLSDARSRATELAVSLGSRLGSGHRLTALANVAASNIEDTLRAVRNTAASGSESRSALQSEPQPAATTHEAHSLAPVPVSFSTHAGLDSEHWLSLFIDELMALARGAGGITFESTERLLQQRKDEFLRDFLTARRMYRTYPRLFPELAAEGGQQA